MQLKRQREKLRTQYQDTENVYEKTVIIERIKSIKEHITDKMKEHRSRRIIKVAHVGPVRYSVQEFRYQKLQA